MDHFKRLSNRHAILIVVLIVAGSLAFAFLMTHLDKIMLETIMKGFFEPLMSVVLIIYTIHLMWQFIRFGIHGKLNKKRTLYFITEILLYLIFDFFVSMSFGDAVDFWRELIVNHVNIFAK